MRGAGRRWARRLNGLAAGSSGTGPIRIRSMSPWPRRRADDRAWGSGISRCLVARELRRVAGRRQARGAEAEPDGRSEEHTSELQSQSNLVCRLLLEKKKKTQ